MNKTDVLIIGAGPTGLFCAHQLGIIGLSCEIVDNLDKAGGQCIELYPDKPIYDIPAVPECTGEELTNNLLKQIKPFKIKFHLNERVEELKKNQNRWHVKTSNGVEFDVANGLSVMEGALQNNITGIDADCGGSMACATCHVYVKEEWLDKLPAKEDGEEDMLDMAFEPKSNSRLSCQLIVSDELDGLEVNIPSKQG